MIPHQGNNIISKEQMEGLTHVDISVGGDHGGGKFLMTLKILFRFHESPTVSWLFQIASVCHSKDDTEILAATVLNLVWFEKARVRSLVFVSREFTPATRE